MFIKKNINLSAKLNWQCAKGWENYFNPSRSAINYLYKTGRCWKWYLTQSQYPVVFYSQFKNKHYGKAFFSDNIVSFLAEPGDKLRIYKSGKVEKIN